MPPRLNDGTTGEAIRGAGGLLGNNGGVRMTDIEYRAIGELAGCSFLPATFDKRIARQWYEMSQRDMLKPMTEKGRAMLWRLVWKYRRQIADKKIVEYAALITDVPAAQKYVAEQLSEKVAESNQPSLFA
jgi:hypothetical protein